MRGSLGLDLGRESIGWVLVYNDREIKTGTRIFPNTSIVNKRQNNPLKNVFIKTKTLPLNQKVIIVLFAILIILTILDLPNWQFWLGLTITVLLTFLTIKK